MGRIAPLVLVLDDDVDFLEISRHVLEAGGYRVVCVGDPDDALKQMAAEKPALVVSDLMMTSLVSGFRFAKEVRGDARFKDVRVLIVTGIASQRGFDFQPRSAEEMAAMGVDGFLAKPVTPENLLAKVRELIG